MPIQRKFFDWSTPALPRIVDWLCDTRLKNGLVDLSDVILVFPGGRAGRQFSKRLTERTQGRNDPPQIVTPSGLPELLYPPQRPFANALTQRLAWTSALQTLSPTELRVLTSRPPDGDEARWRSLAELLMRNHTELAADGLDFAKVAVQGNGLEHDRWQILWNVQDRYLALLDRMELWDRETARLKAIENHECHTDSTILLVAAVDMNRTLRQMLDQVADRVIALVHAPESLADAFDEHGCLRAEAWEHREIGFERARITFADGPAEQAAEVAYALADLDGHYPAQEVTIGIPDESLVPFLRRQLGDCGIPTRSIVEKPMSLALPVTFLAAVADYLDDPRTPHLAALIRHPDVVSWLEQQNVEAGWLTELDEYIAGHLQPRLGNWLGTSSRWTRIRHVVKVLHQLLQPLRKPPTLLHEWSDAVTSVLLSLYGSVSFDENNPAQRITVLACRRLQDALQEPTQVPIELMPTATAAEAIRLALEDVANDVIPPERPEEAVELLGWLEMPLDDSPVAIITSFNEGFVPTSVNSDLFLPNGLRQKLGVFDNARRYARDAYALSVILNSRRSVTLVSGRRDQDGNLLKPSRLLFAAPPETIARRVQQFYSENAATHAARPPLAGGLTTERESAGFTIPRPQPLDEADTAVSVTGFKSYLACPYRFYLSHRLGLSSLTDQVDELDAPSFGNLLHDVLAEFGTSELRHSSESGEIAAFLRKTLDTFALRKLGEARLPAVRIQLEQMERRLEGFAIWQAQHVDLGYRIRYVESPSHNDPVPFDLGDGRSIWIKGRIDRIDYNERDRSWLILDYKTGSKGESPEQTHRTGRKKDAREWIDLQLPLYRHLARPLGVTSPVQVGYIVLPERSQHVGLVTADWTADDYESADEVARDIGRKILDGVFWPPTAETELKHPNTDFAVICHEGTFDREVLEERLA